MFANTKRTFDIWYPDSRIINWKIARYYRIITLSNNNLLLSRSNRIHGGNVLRIIFFSVPLLLVVEVFHLTLVRLGFLGLTGLRCPSTLYLFFILFILLFFLKRLTSRRRPSHNIHRLLLELVILLKVLQQPQQTVVINCRLCHLKMSKEREVELG